MKLHTFIWVFILSVLSSVVFMVFYLKAIFSFVHHADMYEHTTDPFAFFANIFTPQVIISLIIMIITSLAYRIMGIVWIAKNNIISGGEKALWIVGFIILGFVTAIVFLALAKSRKLIPAQQAG
jgi:magnesium-transporting ATPase (P-type)